MSNLTDKMLQKIPIENPEIIKAVEHYLPAAYTIMVATSSAYLKAESKMVHIAPKSYLDMLHLFQIMLQRKYSENDAKLIQLKEGVSKLKKASADVIHLEGTCIPTFCSFFCVLNSEI